MSNKKLTEHDYKQVFEDTAQGQAILEELVSRFSMGPSFDEHNAVLKTYYREGQRSVINFILSRINRANGVNDEIPQDE